jgi:hypothetical protein
VVDRGRNARALVTRRRIAPQRRPSELTPHKHDNAVNHERRGDLRPSRPVVLPAGIIGDDRRRAAIAARFARGICAGWKEAGGRYVKDI